MLNVKLTKLIRQERKLRRLLSREIRNNGYRYISKGIERRLHHVQGEIERLESK